MRASREFQLRPRGGGRFRFTAGFATRAPARSPSMSRSTIRRHADVLAALERPLSAADVAAAEAILPPDAIAGARYPAPSMKQLDSER